MSKDFCSRSTLLGKTRPSGAHAYSTPTAIAVSFMRNDMLVPVGRPCNSLSCRSCCCKHKTMIAKFMGPKGAPLGPRWALCWPHEPCYLGSQTYLTVYEILKGLNEIFMTARYDAVVAPNSMYFIWVSGVSCCVLKLYFIHFQTTLNEICEVYVSQQEVMIRHFVSSWIQ